MNIYNTNQTRHEYAIKRGSVVIGIRSTMKQAQTVAATDMRKWFQQLDRWNSPITPEVIKETVEQYEIVPIRVTVREDGIPTRFNVQNMPPKIKKRILSKLKDPRDIVRLKNGA